MRSIFRGAPTAAALLLFSSGIAAPSSFACGFDGLMGDGFSAEHPKSMEVAFAISDAVTQGIVNKVAIAPVDPGSQGYWRAVGHITSFQRLLSIASDSSNQSGISLLFIESRLWSRIIPGPKGLDLQVHTAGASPDDVVILTNQTVLAAVIDGAMQAQTALDLGLLAIDGKKDQAEAMRQRIIAATDRSLTRDIVESPALPFRLFGPKR
jgi:hypothetical protein